MDRDVPPPNPYDLVPYPAAPRRDTHPDRLAAMARLFGLTPTPPERCRVLEVGCSDGGNLIPMALTLPESDFLGIDLSRVEVDAGRALAQRLGLGNVALELADITLFERSRGAFDYIVAHGILSWVPGAVQEALLALIGAHLAPHGVAYVSYNAFPGWKIRGRVRAYLLERTAHLTDPRARIALARTLLQTIGDALPELPPKERAYLQEVVEDPHIGHDLIGEVNDPFAFRDVVARAVRHGLVYMCESDITDTARCPERGAGRIAAEEALDAARGRSFRRSLLVRAEAPLSLVALTVPGVDARPPPARYAAEPGPTPTASPLARVQAVERSEATNLRHSLVRLTDAERRLLPLLDGTRDRAALAAALSLGEESVDAMLLRLAQAALLTR